MNYWKKLASLLALSAGISFASACKPAGEEGNGNGGYDSGMPPEEQCLSPEEFKETTIYSSTTVCPGTYRGVALKVASDDVTLQGNEVTLDGLLAGGTAIYAEGISRLAVKEFTLKDYLKGVHLKDVKDSSIENTNYSTVGYGTAIQSERGLAIRIAGGELNGDLYLSGSSYEIKNASFQTITAPGDPPSLNGLQAIGNTIRVGVYVDGGQGNVIKGNVIEGNYEETSIKFRDADNVVIEDNTLQNGAIRGEHLTRSTIRNNIIDGQGTIDGCISVVRDGLTYEESGNVTVESNTVKNCHRGITIGTNNAQAGRNINLLQNTVQFSRHRGVYFNADDSLVESNIITGNKLGLEMVGCSNIIKNNDLRNNEEGNYLAECSNTYEGNIEQ